MKTDYTDELIAECEKFRADRIKRENALIILEKKRHREDIKVRMAYIEQLVDMPTQELLELYSEELR